MCLDYFFKKKYGITPPVDTDDISMGELWNVLNGSIDPNNQTKNILLADEKYKVAPISEYQRFVAWDDTDKIKYVSEYYDCDDFSFRLFGNITIPKWSDLAFGILWVLLPSGNGHAINICVDSNWGVWGIEPQDDNFFKIPQDWKVMLVIM